MAFEKVTFVDNQTVITAKQMNSMQDAIIENRENISSLQGLVGGGTGGGTGGGLDPLIGTTEEITPEKVLEAIGMGREVVITHTHATFGTFAFTGFVYSEVFNVVIASGITRYYENQLNFQLFGNIGNAVTPWSMEYATLATKQDAAKAFYVNVVQDGHEYKADKTVDEINEAYLSGCPVYAMVDTVILPLSAVDLDAGSYIFATMISVPSETITLTVEIYVDSGNTLINVSQIATANEVFFSSVLAAVTYVYSGATDTCIANITLQSPSVKVSSSDTGLKTITLLDDTYESDTIIVKKDCIINLNGHSMIFDLPDVVLEIAEGVNCTVDGSITGSSVRKENVNVSANTFFIRADGADVKLIGGEYRLSGNVDGHMIGIRVGDTCQNFTMDGCTLIVANGATTNGSVIGVQTQAAKCDIINSVVDASAEHCSVCALRDYKVLDVTNCDIKATLHTDGSLKSSYGIDVADVTSVLTVNGGHILADAPGCHATGDDETGYAIVSKGIAHLNNVYVNGTHSGVSNMGQLYVSGGTYIGYCHGGFYFMHGSNGVAYINDATIKDGNYEGIFADKFAALQNQEYGAFYVGGTSDENGCNMNVYLDNCTIEGTNYSFVMRGSDGETNNTAHLSNCTIVDGANKPINIHSDTHTVEIGCGCNITSQMATKPERLSFVGRLFRKVHGDKILDGQDYKALAKSALDEWETIIDYTVPEDCAEVFLKTDLNGNPFKLKRAIVKFVLMPIADPSKATSTRYTVDGTVTSGIYNVQHYAHGMADPPKTADMCKVQVLHVEKHHDGVYLTWIATSPSEMNVNDSHIGSRIANVYEPFDPKTTKMKVTEISAAGVGSYATAIGAGTHIVMLGVRE